MTKEKYIFSFWEPKNKIHDYLKLCIKTWKKFMPDYRIVILDYKSLYDWIEEDTFDKKLFQYFSLPKQADVIRYALLYKYGGVWLDTDTILFSTAFQDIASKATSQSETTFIETDRKFHPYTGIIIAQKGSDIMKKCIEEAKKRIDKFGKPKNQLILTKLFNNKEYKAYKNWDFLSNAILDKIILGENTSKYLPLDNKVIKALPETIHYSNLPRREAYCKFYFEDNFCKKTLDKNTSIICLHNSWTPEKYLYMNSKEFLNCNITLANILRELVVED